MISTARGMQNLFLDMYDSPAVVMSFADACAQLWIEVTQRLERLIPSWHGGNVGFFGVWAPAYSPMAQNDTSVSVSVRQYAEIMLPADRMTVRAWRYQMFHTHSGGAHLLDTMLDFLGGGQALNIVLDPNGPTLPELFPVLGRIQERRVPVHLLARTWADVDLIRSTLSPVGLAITCLAGRPPDA